MGGTMQRLSSSSII